MKTNSSIRLFLLCSTLVCTTSSKALEVHEWGTFTVLFAADGRMANWYVPFSDIAQLPTFTNNSRAMKQGIGLARVRMETPVIYFYPEEETDVRVRVMFRDGLITERFPAAIDKNHEMRGVMPTPFSIVPSSVPGNAMRDSDRIFDEKMESISARPMPIITQWSGRLLPPGHADAKFIPSVAGHKGENYGAAREVPNAWIFRGDSPVIKAENKPDIHPVEKFIFYRGAGQAAPPYSVSMRDERTMTFTNYSASASSFQVALRVRDGMASWKKMPSLPEPKEYADRSTSITFPEETISIEQADEELSALFLIELTSRGLTTDEAKAMINTWNHTWFSEPGQRVFTIVDRAWVDSILPLAITPDPQIIERVFVARFEVLSPETEHKLAMLMAEQKASDQAVSNFKALQLGRFANGAAELVADQVKEKALGSYSELLNRSIESEPR